MNKKLLVILNLALAVSLSAAHAATIRANRVLCAPQNADMSQQTSFSSTCEWSKMQPGMDTNAQITLNGKQNIHAECSFTGPDHIAMIMPAKHAEFAGMFSPGNEFSFDIKYREIIDSSDDNQNILFYLQGNQYNEADTLTCHFTVLS